MPELIVRDESRGEAWSLWPYSEPIPSGAIHETGSYLFELSDSPDAGDADLLIGGFPLESLRVRTTRTARWRWSPGFYAGTVEIELRLPGNNPRRIEVVTDPDLRKLTRANFDTMVREIMEDTFALFSLGSFRRSVARGSGSRPPAIARLEFLRSRVDELQDIVSGIVLNPRHRLTAEEKSLPYHRVKRASGAEILKSFRTGRIRPEQSGPSHLPSSLKGFLPEEIRIRQRLSSLDLPEHRQMGACLRSWSSWLSAVAGTLRRSDPIADTETRRERAVWSARCGQLARRLARMAAEAPFAEAGDALPVLRLSATFRNDPAYRRFFRLAQDMNLGIAAVFGSFLDMPLARTFDLYELWCFLRLVRAATLEFGPEGLKTGDLFISDAAGGLTIAASAVTVPVGHDWKLCFQKQYREFWIEPSGKGSFSRVMIPDIVIAREPSAGAERLIVLDAKYRIEEGLNSALNSIHTYRDALVHAQNGSVEGIVSAAYLLTPYLPEIKTGYRDTPMPGRLFHPEYRSSFRFGAVTVRPGMAADQLRDALQTIIADAKVSG